MKGRNVPPRPEVAEIVRKAEPLTMGDIEHALETGIDHKYSRLLPILSAKAEQMPEPTPYERGFLDRFQDRKRHP